MIKDASVIGFDIVVNCFFNIRCLFKVRQEININEEFKEPAWIAKESNKMTSNNELLQKVLPIELWLIRS